MKQLLLLGLNFKKAPISVRERFYVEGESVTDLLKTFQREPFIKEAVLLSTCNRTEVIVRISIAAKKAGRRTVDRIIDIFAEQAGISLDTNFFYWHWEMAAIQHLFSVAAGIDSQIIGERQILGQVREAYRLACAAGTNGFLINKIFHAAFRVGKRARTETQIGKGAVSISLAAVQHGCAEFKDLTEKTALVIGAGNMARLLVDHLRSKEIGCLLIANRTAGKAAMLAEKSNGRMVDLEDVKGPFFTHTDMVFVAVSGHAPLLSADKFLGHQRKNGKPLLVIDIAVPRGVHPNVGDLHNIRLINIDRLQQAVDTSRDLRLRAVPFVRDIIREESEKVLKWFRTLDVAPTIKELVACFENERLAEMRTLKMTDEAHRKAVDDLTKRLVKRFLKRPITRLKTSCATDLNLSPYWVDAVRNILLGDFQDE